MVFNTTFNNISVISWRSVLLVEETGEPEQTLSHNVVSSTPRNERDSNSKLLVVICTVVLNPSTIRSRPRQPLCDYVIMKPYFTSVVFLFQERKLAYI
jgi:hypothetical protein